MARNKPREVTWQEDANGCHNCTSHKPNNEGYPRFTKDGYTTTMHRHLYEQAHGRLPKDQVVRHKCDNRLCINLEHLEPGTVQQNSDDMVLRGRSMRGERHRSHKLTGEEVRQIRRLRAGGASGVSLAGTYGVSQAQVSRICSRHRWGWIK